ncbi:short-chain fatty acid transporter [Pseudogracilibacillus auburnensis]|uniref:Short-chain fatty acids transporter n=1 Tax=Pseudogracilibacillus auburnensis TaxID=1494959 RepID=A0A2V3WDI1_9BACI|nr:TIGR00366 family protein [Pseudogracilibacillus auburnensis]MBO1002027.1 short-chain fatty acid transporter [Pseudogracilibacillus auburnensis]PXW90255.1 short-chain fatty acids transporter [Pseudogracilibacillus auburnensis]
MLSKIADRFSKIVQRYLPDALVIAVLMTVIVLAIALLMNPTEPGMIFKSWGDGFWAYLAFTMQMVLLLMTGMTLASVPFINRGLAKIAHLANKPWKAYLITFLVSASAYYINWGLAVVVGAIIAREIGKRNKNTHFPLLVACAYSATVLFPGGISSSIGLTVATEGHFLEDVMGVIPTSETIFDPATIIIFLSLVVTMSIFIIFMIPKEKIIAYQPKEKPNEASSTSEVPKGPLTPAFKLEHTPILGMLIGTVGIIYTVISFTGGRDLDLDIINIFFLSLGLFFHRSLGQFARAFTDVAKSISPIILQFPFYAGIIALLGSSGLGQFIVDGMISVATPETFNLFTYWVAGFVNILAPSGGGQWALQGPLQIPAAIELGVDPAKTAMAIAWGDGWTNLIQPFWALPILSVVGLHIRDIMGYCILLSTLVGVVTSILIFFLY